MFGILLVVSNLYSQDLLLFVCGNTFFVIALKNVSDYTVKKIKENIVSIDKIESRYPKLRKEISLERMIILYSLFLLITGCVISYSTHILGIFLSIYALTILMVQGIFCRTFESYILQRFFYFRPESEIFREQFTLLFCEADWIRANLKEFHK